MRFETDIHGLLGMNHNNFGDPPTFSDREFNIWGFEGNFELLSCNLIQTFPVRMNCNDLDYTTFSSTVSIRSKF